MRSGWLTTGPNTRSFEKNFAEFVGAKHAIAVNSCTAALHLALAGIGVGPGDEVIMPTMTFAATAEVAIHLGAIPVLVDVSSENLNVDPLAVEGAVSERTRAIIPVHYGGQAADLDSLLDISTRTGIPIIEDAAHAFPTRSEGRLVGTFGRATCFSFYATKTITTAEGGMITTDDGELADAMRSLSLHGLSSDAWNRFGRGAAWDYSIVAAGYKYNMTDVASALGLTQLARAEEMRTARQRVAEAYLSRLGEITAAKPLAHGDASDHSWHLFVIRLDLERLAIGRNEFIRELNQRGVGTSVHYRPLHMHRYYVDRWGFEPSDYPVAGAAFDDIISLPIFPDMTRAEVDYVMDSIEGIAISHLR